jgi:hypothetical protein
MMEISGKYTLQIYSKYCINDAALCSGNNSVDYISEVFSSLNRPVEISVDSFCIGLLKREIP